MKGVNGMLLSEAKRCEVHEDSAYRGLRLFMPKRNSAADRIPDPNVTRTEITSRDRGAPSSSRGGGLRELVLK